MLIRTQIRLGLAVTAVVVLIGGGVHLKLFRRAAESESIRTWANLITKNVFECNVFGAEFALQKSERPRVQYTISSKALDTLLNSPPSPRVNQEKIQEIRDRKKRMDDVVAHFARAQAEGGFESDPRFAWEVDNMLTAQIFLHSQAMLNSAMQLRDGASRESTRVVKQYATWGGAMILAIFLAAAFLTIFCYRRILNPLQRLSKAAQAIGRGNLNVRVPFKHLNELGQLSQTFNTMTGQLSSREAELQGRIREMDAFCYSIAHDLKAPLRAVAGYATVLNEEHSQALAGEGQVYVRRMDAAVKRMDVLIDGLLQYGTLTHQKLELVPVDLEQVLSDVLADGLASVIAQRKAILEKDGPFPKVIGNSLILRTVFQNLISNALKYGPTQGTPKISLSAVERDGSVKVFFQDNGIGIAAEHHERIFGLFERLHTAETYAGTGLGLAIVKKGMERMGGSVTVSSTLGEGSIFTLTLPSAVRQDRTTSVSSSLAVV